MFIPYMSSIYLIPVWILNSDVSNVEGYTYIWDDTAIWDDAAIWKD